MANEHTAVKPYELNRDNAPAFWQVDILWLILADATQTGGALTLMEQVCPRGSGPPPHTHAQQESFYVLEGEMTVLVGGQTLVAKQGSFLNIPPDTVHSFRVETETARILNMYVPAGFERMITEFGEPAPARVLPPPGRPMRAKPADVQRVMQEVGMTWRNEPDTLRQQPDAETKTGR